MENKLFCKGGGCTAKLGPAALKRVLSLLPKNDRDPDLLVGFDSSDDAAVYRVAPDLAIVQTLDFFPPMIEDPYLFGQIAATNALSDIYAMGGTVKTALNIVCFPENGDLNVLGEILRGGSEKVIEAGGTLCGGHSIADTDVKYGLSVMGTVHPDRIWSNDTGRAGDVLIFTKRLGTGLVCTAARVNAVTDAELQSAIASMTTLNRRAAEIAQGYEVHACTDVTGFGFLGHLSEMVHADISAEIDMDRIRILPGARRAAEECLWTAAGQRNRNHVGDRVCFVPGITPEDEEILFDPQTSGGLLIAVPEEQAQNLLSDLQCARLPASIVGRFTPKQENDMIVKRGMIL